MYLIKLPEHQIAQYWEVIKFAIKEALPPIASDTEDKINNLLEALMINRLQCWIVSADAENTKAEVVLTTRISEDEISKTRSLLIYTLYSFKPLAKEAVDAIKIGLVKYAKVNHCDRLIAYTDSANVVSIATNFGASNQWTFLSLDV